MRNDMLDVIRERLRESGFENVFPTMPDGRVNPEATVLTFGVPEIRTVDFAGSQEEIHRITIIVKRISEAKAQEDANEAYRMVTTSDLESENGSYDLVRVEPDLPRPLPWNESGRWVWAFDAKLITERKDI